jgi:hypothetical protein
VGLSLVTKRSKRLRRIVIGTTTFLWKVEHAHHVLAPPVPGEGREGRCREVFTAFLDGDKRTPLRVWFTDAADRHAGYPEAGCLWAGELRVNLNEPGVARRVIELGLAQGWRSTAAKGEFVVEDGFAYLQRLAEA